MSDQSGAGPDVVGQVGAQPEPVAADGVGAVAVGTGLWVVGLVVSALLHRRLAAAGAADLVWVCAAGVVVGGIMGVIVWRRHLVYRAHRAATGATT